MLVLVPATRFRLSPKLHKFVAKLPSANFFKPQTIDLKGPLVVDFVASKTGTLRAFGRQEKGNGGACMRMHASRTHVVRAYTHVHSI